VLVVSPLVVGASPEVVEPLVVAFEVVEPPASPQPTMTRTADRRSRMAIVLAAAGPVVSSAGADLAGETAHELRTLRNIVRGGSRGRAAHC